MKSYLNVPKIIDEQDYGFLYWSDPQKIFLDLVDFKDKGITKIYTEILPDELPDLINTELHAYLCDVFVPLSDFSLTLNINEINSGMFLHDGELSLLEKNILKALNYEHKKIVKTECIIRNIEIYNRLVVRNNNPVISSICEYYNSNIDNKIYFCDQINLSPLRFLNKSKMSNILKTKDVYSIREYYKKIYQFKSDEKLRNQTIKLEFESFEKELVNVYKLNERKDIWATDYKTSEFPFKENIALTKHQKKLYYSISKSNIIKHSKLKTFCQNNFLNNYFSYGQFDVHWEYNLNEIFDLIPNSLEFIINKIKGLENQTDKKRLASYFTTLISRSFSRNKKNPSQEKELYNYFNILTELSLPNRSNELFLNFINKSKGSQDLLFNYSNIYKNQPKAYKRMVFINISYFYDFEAILPFFKLSIDEGLEFEFIWGIIKSLNINPVRFLYDKKYRKDMHADISSLSDYLESNIDIYKYSNNFPFLFPDVKLKNAIPLVNHPEIIAMFIPLINSDTHINLINTAISNLDFSIINQGHFKLLYFCKLYKLESITEFLNQKLADHINLPEFNAWEKAFKLIDNIDYHKNLSLIEKEIPYWFIFSN